MIEHHAPERGVAAERLQAEKIDGISLIYRRPRWKGRGFGPSRPGLGKGAVFLEQEGATAALAQIVPVLFGSWFKGSNKIAGSCQTLDGQAWIVLEDIASPFIMDRFCPPSKHKSYLCDPDEQIAKRSRVEDVRVVDGDDGLLHQ